jgi:aminopeptidase N
MRPGFEGDVAAATGLPRYHLRLWADPRGGVLTGTEQIDFTNRTDAPLADIALRLYPNFSRDVFGRGGDLRMEVTSAAVAGQPVAASYAAQRTAVLLPVGQPLVPGASTTVAVTFTATLRRADDGAWQLPAYYPMLAVHEAGTWRLDVTRFADRVYAESALYEATVDVPAELRVIATGSTLAVEPRGERATYRIVTGPVREFALVIGDFAAAHEQAGDVEVNVYTRRGSHLDAGQVARVAAGALAVFDRRFGPYPYRELDIHLLPGEHDGGDEYPGLILLTSDAQVDAGTRYVAAHEVAHQWWYGVIGNDIYRQPWLDEAFAQYSGIIYAEDAAGPSVAAADWEREVLRRYRGALADGDLPAGRAIDGYPNFNVYYRTVYGKGAVFLRTLREDLGDDAFFRALQSYYGRHRYEVGTTASVRRAFEEASGRDLAGLFRAWIGPE